MSKSKGSIKLLLDAEQKAADIVKEAKKNRLQKSKHARDDADREIQKYKENAERKYNQYKNEQVGTTSQGTHELEARKQRAISDINKNVEKVKPEVLNFMVNFVLDVNTDIPAEQKVHIERKVLSKAH
ncbi:V-type H+-transporting ATPase subunit G [Acrasis kona]|uniref:V-type proton ATPase subunit G n=1 Tax=Acrasis kona TaxID=1008807 RepID=A0AAW2YUT2_9EUKA